MWTAHSSSRVRTIRPAREQRSICGALNLRPLKPLAVCVLCFEQRMHECIKRTADLLYGDKHWLHTCGVVRIGLVPKTPEISRPISSGCLTWFFAEIVHALELLCPCSTRVSRAIAKDLVLASSADQSQLMEC